MSAPSSVCSDDSFEKLDPEELEDDAQPMYKPKVTFHEVFDVYPMDADIVARVTFDDDYVKSDKDTAIVVPLAWKSVDQALCATNIVANHVRFDVKELPKTGSEEIFYQLCYCTEDKIVMGVSIPFLFREVREDELIEFQKERNNEFWTFRSRFAVLMDIYWNYVIESHIKSAMTDQLPSAELTEVLDGDKKGNSPETDVDRTSRVLLFQIMKLDLEEMKKQCEEMKMQYEGEKSKNEELFSLIKGLFKPFNTTDRKNCIEVIKKLSAMYPEESFEYNSSYMRVIIKMMKMGEYETITEKQPNDAEKKKIMLLLQLLRIVFTGCKFTSSVNRDTCVNFLREIEHLFTEEKNDLERLITMIRYDGDFAPKDIQSKEETPQDVVRCNAHFVATSNGDILLAPECDKETPLKSAVVGEGVGNNVPDDWKAEKASLLEKCSKLEDEIKTKDEIIQGLQEKLINQEQGEVEKVIAATDKVHETYAREMKKLVAANKSIGELLRAKEEERKLMMARVEIPIVSMEAEIEDKEKIIESLKEEIAQHEETYEIFINKLDSQMKEIKESNKKMAELNELLAKKDDTISNLERQLVNFNTHTCEASSSRRVVELEERLQTVYTTLWDERREMIKLRDSLQILQAQLNSLRDQPAKRTVWKRGEALENLALLKATRSIISEPLQVLSDGSKSEASSSSQRENKSKKAAPSKLGLFKKVLEEQMKLVDQNSEGKEQSAESPAMQARRKRLLDWGQAICQLNHQVVVLKRELNCERQKVSELTKENEDLKQQAGKLEESHSESEVAESEVDKLREEMENLRKNARDLEEKMKIMAEEKAADKHEYDALQALHKKTVADLEAKLKDAELNRSIEENAAFAKLVEEREVTLDLHSKEVLSLEARLKEGAKQYAKLYMKYEKLARSSQSSNSNSLT